MDTFPTWKRSAQEVRVCSEGIHMVAGESNQGSRRKDGVKAPVEAAFEHTARLWHDGRGFLKLPSASYLKTWKHGTWCFDTAQLGFWHSEQWVQVQFSYNFAAQTVHLQKSINHILRLPFHNKGKALVAAHQIQKESNRTKHVRDMRVTPELSQ